MRHYEVVVDQRGHRVPEVWNLPKGSPASVTVFDPTPGVPDSGFNNSDGSVRVYITGWGSSCSGCGERVEFTVEDEKVFAVTSCAWVPRVVKVRLSVPSGKIAYGDSVDGYSVDMDEPADPSLGDWDSYLGAGVEKRESGEWDSKQYGAYLDAYKTKYASYNSALGQVQAIEAYAEQGAAYGAVGNSCPGIYRSKTDGTYLIANPAYDVEEEESDYDNGTNPDWVEVGSICTDLWAYTLADYDDYVAKGGDPEHLQGTIDVTPGTYEFFYYVHDGEFDALDYKDEQVFATFALIEEA